MPIVLTRATKLEARYKALGGSEHCSACRFYMPQGTCGRIIGPVSPEGWCKYYSREAVQRWSNPGYAGSGGGLPAGATLNLNFMIPGTLDPTITFTRSSTGTYFDSTGTMQTAATNAPRWDYDPVTLQLRGLLIEEARTNLLLNSATLGTQSVAVTAQAYTLSFYGTGTITRSGAATGALAGTGAFPQRVTQTFTPTAGTLTLTVTGSVLNAQIEVGTFATSYIPTTGATGSRTQDLCNLLSSPWYSAAASTLAIEYMVYYATAPGITPVVAELNDNTANNIYSFRMIAPNVSEIRVFSSNISAGFSQLTFTANTPIKAAATFGTGLSGNFTQNGAPPQAYTFTAAPVSTSRLVIGFGRQAPLDGWVRRVTYWPRQLSNTELQQVTT